jgi:hypothetical protein
MRRFFASLAMATLFAYAPLSWAALTPEDRAELKSTYEAILQKQKGPFTINYCTCVNGKLAPVADENLRVRPDPCGELEGVGQLFCSAYRNDLAKKLATHGLYIANVFSNEVYLWDQHEDHHRLAKGFILEKYYMDTHPESKLTTSRAYGGISGAEFEAQYGPIFFKKYYALQDWSDFRHYLIQYELQRRYFARSSMSLINDIRSLSTSIYRTYPPFKPIRDLTHNRLSAGLIPMIEEFQRNHTDDKKNSENYKKLINLLRQLTSLDKKDLKEFLSGISNANIKKNLEVIIESEEGSPLILLHRLGELAAEVRGVIAERLIDLAEAVQLVNLNVTINALTTATLGRLMSSDRIWTAGELLAIQRDVIGGVYGAGLISRREYDSAKDLLNGTLETADLTLEDAYKTLNRASRVVEWAQASIRAAFSDVWDPWVYLFPDVQSVTDDIIRSSPLLGYATLVGALRDHLLSKLNLQHHILGRATTERIRALNPGLAMGQLKFLGDGEEYTHDDILALDATNADLEPVGGIITKDEGNVVSHLQLLARSLGVPNSVFPEALFATLRGLKDRSIFYVVTPMGRVILKETSEMDETDRVILSEYERRRQLESEGELSKQSSKLKIDASRLNLEETRVLPLEAVRRQDSGVICGPKAAFVGELKHHFPDNVAQGLVIPFGIYNSHFIKAKVAVPKEMANKNLVQPGTSVLDFFSQTYDTFYKDLLMDPNMTPPQLKEWISPRLDVIRYSIREIALDPAFVESLKTELDSLGLFSDQERENMHGVFIRSDTNVEDLPNFSGAGLNLTIFNVTKFSELLNGIKEVWASPFTFRSFSWRQSIISDPKLVFPSILVLASVPSEKSGVLVTADLETEDQTFMTIATAEGVGGTVDGSPAETLLYGHERVVLLSQFKSSKCKKLNVAGTDGAQLVDSSGSEYVLKAEELQALVAAAAKIKQTFPPELNAEGQPLPWDIEYGFVDEHLYLFQVRPFAGSGDLKNLPSLAALDRGIREKGQEMFCFSESVKWQP